jgi:acyl carrier protein
LEAKATRSVGVSVTAEIESYILEHLVKGKVSHVGRDESLIGSGVIDSVRWLQLVSFIEKRYRITVEDDELAPETFDSINNISAYVVRKQADTGR